jgi:DNA methylase
MTVRILDGDCRDVLRTLPDASVDSVVTDPPYELGFMGKSWDSTGIAYDVTVWRECLRVLKPGGHLLAFGGSRTYHRLACAVEDAGFEIRDQIMWIYGSGFPKSLDVSKAIDKSLGGEREQTRAGIVQRGGLGEDWDTGSSSSRPRFDKPATEAARQWQGWGTALKPAHEPIVVARKPLIGTVAANVLEHGTGAINVDGCRVATDETIAPFGSPKRSSGGIMNATDAPREQFSQCAAGRWPANVIHDGSEEVLAAFGSAARFFYTAKASGNDREVGLEEFDLVAAGGMQGRNDGSLGSITMRKNHHPTVKPTDLMRYLVKLVTPPGGTVLDPFAGSGSTGRGADIEQFDAILIELNPEYAAIARKRISGDAPLFASVA